MDPRTFDRFARLVASKGTRRALLSGCGIAVVASMGRWGDAGAQSTGVFTGESCTVTEDCAIDPMAGSSIVCGDNGIAGGNGPVCCHPGGGGCCSDDAQCCGALVCRVTGDDICGARCGEGPKRTQRPGEYCSDTFLCIQYAGAGPVSCADNGVVTDDGASGLNCCHSEGGRCSTDAGCCAGLSCYPNSSGNGGICGYSVDVTRLPAGAPCVTRFQCIADGANSFCSDNGILEDGELNCCYNAGGPCSSASECCRSLQCVEGVCVGEG